MHALRARGTTGLVGIRVSAAAPGQQLLQTPGAPVRPPAPERAARPITRSETMQHVPRHTTDVLRSGLPTGHAHDSLQCHRARWAAGQQPLGLFPLAAASPAALQPARTHRPRSSCSRVATGCCLHHSWHHRSQDRDRAPRPLRYPPSCMHDASSFLCRWPLAAGCLCRTPAMLSHAAQPSLASPRDPLRAPALSAAPLGRPVSARQLCRRPQELRAHIIAGVFLFFPHR